MNDMPIHLNQTKGVGGTEASVTAPVWITQSALDGIVVLLAYCNAVGASGKGTVPGSHELTMHYRQLRDAIQKAKSE